MKPTEVLGMVIASVFPVVGIELVTLKDIPSLTQIGIGVLFFTIGLYIAFNIHELENK